MKARPLGGEEQREARHRAEVVAQVAGGGVAERGDGQARGAAHAGLAPPARHEAGEAEAARVADAGEPGALGVVEIEAGEQSVTAASRPAARAATIWPSASCQSRSAMDAAPA
jgi:hypothetical protein